MVDEPGEWLLIRPNTCSDREEANELARVGPRQRVRVEDDPMKYAARLGGAEKKIYAYEHGQGNKF